MQKNPPYLWKVTVTELRRNLVAGLPNIDEDKMKSG